MTGQPNGDFDLSFIQITGKNNFGALTVLSLSQDVDEEQEDHIDAEYRLSTLNWKLSDSKVSGSNQIIKLQKGPIDHLHIPELSSDSFLADSSGIFLPLFPDPEIRIFDFVAPLFNMNI